MSLKQAALLAGLAGGAFSGVAQAAIYDFSFQTSDVEFGSSIQASGTLDADLVIASVYSVSSATGTINGSKITSASGSLFGGAAGTDNEVIDFNANGVSYLFDGSVVISSAGDGDIGTFTVSNVPLPASAPMFGAALVALGAVGYGLKRKGAAAD